MYRKVIHLINICSLCKDEMGHGQLYPLRTAPAVIVFQVSFPLYHSSSWCTDSCKRALQTLFKTYMNI